MLILVTGFLIFCIAFLYFKRKRSTPIVQNGVLEQKEISEVKPLPGHPELLVDIHSLDGLLETLHAICDKYKEHGITSTYVGLLKFVAIWEPSLIEEITNCPYAQRKGEFYQVLIGSASDGVFSHPGGPEWRELRKPLVSSMAKKYLDNDYFNIFIYQSHALIDFWKQNRVGKCHNLGEDVCPSVFDIFSSTHVGVRTNELHDRKWRFSEIVENEVTLSAGEIFKLHYITWQVFVKVKRLFLKIKEFIKNLAFFISKNPGEKTLDDENKKSFKNQASKIDGKKWWFFKYRDDHKILLESQSFNLAYDMQEALNLYYGMKIIISFVRFKILTYLKYYINNFNMGFTESGKMLKQYDDLAYKCLDYIIEERKRFGMEELDGIEYYTDFLIKRGKERNLTTKKVMLQLSDVIGAGVDTTPAVVSSALLYIAMHPEVQERAFQEQDEIFGDSDRDPTLEDLAKMDYLERVIKETLRFIAPPGVLKVTDEACVIGNYEIPKACVTYINMREVHKCSKYYEKPHEFYPDHFLPEVEATRPRYAYIPFGTGPRMCPGFQYAYLLMKIMISMILRNFILKTPLTLETIQYEYKVMVHVKGGYPLELESRR